MNSGKPLTGLAANPNYTNGGEIPTTPRGDGHPDDRRVQDAHAVRVQHRRARRLRVQLRRAAGGSWCSPTCSTCSTCSGRPDYDNWIELAARGRQPRLREARVAESSPGRSTRRRGRSASAPGSSSRRRRGNAERGTRNAELSSDAERQGPGTRDRSPRSRPAQRLPPTAPVLRTSPGDFRTPRSAFGPQPPSEPVLTQTGPIQQGRIAAAPVTDPIQPYPGSNVRQRSNRFRSIHGLVTAIRPVPKSFRK